MGFLTAYFSEPRCFRALPALVGMTVIGLLLGKAVVAMPLSFSIILVVVLGVSIFSLIYLDLAMVLLIISMLLSPEIIIGSLPGHDIVIRIEDLLLIFIPLFWIARAAVDQRVRKTVSLALNKYILLYSILFIFSTCRGIMNVDINPVKGFFYILKYLEYFMIYFFVINNVKNKGQIKVYLIFFILTFIVVDVYAASQIGHVPRVSAPFQTRSQEPNTLGGYQVLMLSVIMGLILTSRPGKLKLFLIGLAIFSLWPFLYTLSRSSYMALIMSYLSFIWFYSPRRLLLVCILAVMTIATLLFLPGQVRDRLQDTITAHETQYTAPERVFGVTLGPSASARIQSWRIMYNNWCSSPFFGYGITGKGFIDSQYICDLTELGAVGLFAFLLLLRAIFRQVLAIYQRTEDRMLKGLVLGFLAGHVGMITHALTANTFVIVRIMEPYWFLLGMIMVIPKLEDIGSLRSVERKLVA